MAPVQHAPGRVPVVQPTKWVTSLVVVMKKNKDLSICLDLKDINRAIQRKIYPIPTIEDIATRLHWVKVFSTLDVRAGVWHVQLDEQSSLLTTFNTPFGRFK